MTDLSTVRAGYDRWAKVYEHDSNPLQALEEPVVWRAIGDSRGKKVLDLGCGTGRHSWVQPGSVAHSISEFIMRAIRAQLRIADIEEVSPSCDFAAEYPRAARYVDWPMLVVMQLAAGPGTD